jgi:hypothetical protein
MEKLHNQATRGWNRTKNCSSKNEKDLGKGDFDVIKLILIHSFSIHQL